jgi:hypothetical protein
MLSHLPRNVRQHLVLSVFQFDPRHRVRQNLQDLAMTSMASSLAIVLAQDSVYTDKLRIITRRPCFAKPHSTYQLQVAS